MKASIFFVVLITFLTGCNKNEESINQKPELNITIAEDGLKVTLNGNVVDRDGIITELSINWGDQISNRYSGIDYSAIEISHAYSNPATYKIIILVVDNKTDSTIQNVAVTVDFGETSLTGIKSSMYKTSENEYLILTLNLHTYQESQQSAKLNMITDVIGKMDVDFIAFQECAQNKSSAITEGVIRADNMALIITNRIKEKYNVDYSFVWDWAHYGWTVWEEGVAILSKHNLLDSESRYISVNTSTGNITSRKVIYGSYQVNQGQINFFSAHTHWRVSVNDEEQNNQIMKIKMMVDEKELLSPGAISVVCGDFNGNPTSDYPWSEGYNTMMGNSDYWDTFLEANPEANSIPAQSLYFTIGGDIPGRIDYIFLNKDNRCIVGNSQIIFKSDIIGTVSDHFGVLTKIVFTN